MTSFDTEEAVVLTCGSGLPCREEPAINCSAPFIGIPEGAFVSVEPGLGAGTEPEFSAAGAAEASAWVFFERGLGGGGVRTGAVSGIGVAEGVAWGPGETVVQPVSDKESNRTSPQTRQLARV